MLHASYQATMSVIDDVITNYNHTSVCICKGIFPGIFIMHCDIRSIDH